VDFLIVAFALFLLVRQINRLRRQQEAAAPKPATKDCPFCCTAIPLAATRCPNCTSELKGA
jgi:large conductance mechanosensitive channel